MAADSLPIPSVRDFVHRSGEYRIRRAHDEQRTRHYKRAIWACRGRFLFWLRAVGNSQQFDAASLRRASLDRGDFGAVGRSRDDDGIRAYREGIVFVAIPAGPG